MERAVKNNPQENYRLTSNMASFVSITHLGRMYRSAKSRTYKGKHLRPRGILVLAHPTHDPQQQANPEGQSSRDDLIAGERGNKSADGQQPSGLQQKGQDTRWPLVSTPDPHT